MSEQISKRWVEAGIALAGDSKTEVKCPVCVAGTLIVVDIKRDDDSTEFERLMTCPACGARNALRMRRDGDWK